MPEIEKTPELEAAELAELQRKNEEATQRLRDAEKQETQLRAELEQQNFDRAVSDAVKDSGVKFHLNNRDLKKLITSEPGFDVKADGSAFIDGRAVPLAVALRVFASRHQHLTERTKADFEAAKFREETKIKSKADFKNNAEKIAFIREHGGAAFDALPLKPQSDPEKMPTRDLMRLPTREKVRLVNLLGEAGWSALLERNKNL